VDWRRGASVTSVKRSLWYAAAGASAGALAWGLAEPRWYVLRSTSVPVLRPAARRPLRVLHLSDLHQLPGQEHRLRFVRQCAEAAPDMVVVTGDLLESDEAIDDVVEALGDVARGRLALLVLGSHDYWAGRPKNPLEYLTSPHKRRYGYRLDTTRLVDGLLSVGYLLLDNSRRCIDTPAGPIDVAGLGDAHVRFDKPGKVDWSPPEREMALRLGVAHAPYTRVLDQFDRHGFDLVLAGHTHGGQVRVPLIGALTNNTDLPLRQSRGLSHYGADLALHVSAGLGHSRYAPVRFSARPEATLLDLVHRPPRR
jgi:uncharacterized protein